MEHKTNLIFNFRISKVAAVILGFLKTAGSQVRQTMQAVGMIVYRSAVKGVEQERAIDEGVDLPFYFNRRDVVIQQQWLLIVAIMQNNRIVKRHQTLK